MKIDEEKYKEEIAKGAEKVTRKDLSRVVVQADRVLDMVGRVRVLKKFVAQAALLIRMLVDYYDGKYEDVPWRTITMGVFALLYLINPWDLIPDYIPVIGYLDDAAVFGIVWEVIKWDVKEYVEYACKHGLADEKMKSLAEDAFGEVEC